MIRFGVSAWITSVCSLIPVPVLGTAIGIGVAIAVDYLITWTMEVLTDGLDILKGFAADIGDAISRAWDDFTAWLCGVFA